MHVTGILSDFHKTPFCLHHPLLKLFALALGEGDNTDFVAMVEPYPNFNTGKMMITLSTPVYDRSVRPPLLGVVGIDLFMDALEQTLGVDPSSTLMLNRFLALSTTRCPCLNLTGRELDALRYLGGGDRAICRDCPLVDTGGGNYVGILPQQCRGGAVISPALSGSTPTTPALPMRRRRAATWEGARPRSTQLISTL